MNTMPFSLKEQIKRGAFKGKLNPLAAKLGKTFPIANCGEYKQQKELLKELHKEIEQGIELINQRFKNKKL